MKERPCRKLQPGDDARAVFTEGGLFDRHDLHEVGEAVVAKATHPANADGVRPTPLVMVNGGPATPSTDLLALVLPGAPFASLRGDRDMIFVAERGEQHSTSQLKCEELDALTSSIFGDDGLVHPIAQEAKIAATAACAKRHAAAGIDLGAYNVREIADDVHDAVRAAGYDKFSVWGVSFGTGLAQQLAKLFPNEVTSIVLDSPVVFWDQAGRDLKRRVLRRLRAPR